MKVAVIWGTRPEIIKMSPIVKELEKRQLEFFLVHTGQHYSYDMDKALSSQLQMPEAKYNLAVGSGTHAKQTARVLVGLEVVLEKETPEIILAEGDTNSVLAAALAAAKLGIRVGHVEAGLRSYDRSMPEEINRIVSDHCSDYLFAPTEKAGSILLQEGIPENRVFVTGNTIVDAIYQNLEVARGDRGGLATAAVKPQEYFLVTVHRQENVDNPQRFSSILSSLKDLSVKYQLPVVYPIHPHSRKRLEEYGLDTRGITIIEPLDFITFLGLVTQARLILTDSGGVQEEACVLGVPCVTLRDNTERPETVEIGANILAGTLPQNIAECVEKMLFSNKQWPNPFGDGKSAERIISIVVEGSE